MKKTILILLFSSGVLWAAPPSLEVPEEVTSAPGKFVVITPKTDAKTVTWVVKDPSLSVLAKDKLADQRELVLVGLQPGEYKLIAVGSLDDNHVIANVRLVITGDVLPPGPPTPPIPPPTPTPTPTPTPNPVPVPANDFRVILIVDENTNMSREQLNAINSVEVTKYLDEKCTKDGNRPGWRRWDPDVDTSKELPVWKSLWDATKPNIGKTPQVLIVKNQQGKLHPITDEGSLLHLLKQHGDN